MGARGTKTHPAFWMNVEFGTAPNACWLWTGLRQIDEYGQETGYGRFGRLYAHHIVATAVHGPANGLYTLHACDNKPCVNPWHLHRGTQRDNVREAHERKRFVNLRPSVGTLNWRSKLTAEQVLWMRANKAAFSQRQLAKQLGVSQCTIQRVLSGRGYYNVTGDYMIDGEEWE